MKPLLLSLGFLNIFSLPLLAQERFVTGQFSDRYDRFEEHSKTKDLYRPGAALFTFDKETFVFCSPSEDAQLVTKLGIGQRVQNRVKAKSSLEECNWNGYSDIWFPVSGVAANGSMFSGFVKGAQLAKTWQYMDLNNDQQYELVMLGLSSLQRNHLTDIKAEIRVVKNNELIHQQIVPGLCVYEECNSIALIQLFRKGNAKIIEASTLTLGCSAVVEKTYFYWNGKSLDLIYHAELPKNKVYTKESFAYNINTQQMNICSFAGENQQLHPTWNCKTVDLKGKSKGSPTIAYNDSSLQH